MQLPPLTLGTAQTGLSYGIANASGLPDETRAAAVYDAALDSGITWFDTARAYGLAEERIGTWLDGEKHVSLVSKVAAMSDHTDAAAWVDSQIAASRQALRQDSLACILLHRASDIFRPGCRPALERAKAEGRIGGFGISTYTPEDLAEALETGPLDAVQVPINLFDMRLVEQEWPKRLSDNGCSVFVRSVFLQGLLLMQPEKLPASLQLAAPALKQLRAIASAEGLSMTALALGIVRDAPGVGSLVVGAETPEQIRDTAKALPSGPLNANLHRKVADAVADLPAWLLNPSTWPKV